MKKNMAILCIMLGMTSCFTGCSNSNTDTANTVDMVINTDDTADISDAKDLAIATDNMLTPTKAEWTLDQITGADMASLDYASEEQVIFHGYFGLFVYDLNTETIVRSINLKEIGCEMTQGDAYCEVSVNQEGKIVQLHPMNSDKMYIYDVEDNTLEETKYIAMTDRFQTAVNENPNGGTSYEVVKFANGDIGCLYDKTGTLDGLYYSSGEKEYKLFE